MRGRVVAVILGGTVLLGAAGVAAAGHGGGGEKTPRRGSLPPATATVRRTTLTETEDVDGTLGYAGGGTVGGTRGTVTWLAAEGRIVKRGEPVYRADDHEVPLLYGTLPLYRGLATGVKGPDVRQLERNLSALGYTGFTVDETFGDGTAAAVKDWQHDLGVTETGRIEPGAAVIAPGQIRIGKHRKKIGDPASGPVVDYTRTGRAVTVDLALKYQRLAKKGAEVAIDLDGGEGSATGTITKVGAVATKGKDGQDPTIKITIAVTGSLGGFASAPVTVHLAADRHENVLAVPIGALLALPDGGYGVQVVRGASARTVPIEIGMFADGQVEVRGGGLTEGMRVGVPA